MALVLALWSSTVFIDSASLFIAGPAAMAPLVAVLALPVIAIGVASRHVVPTVIAVAAALVPWVMVAGYAASGPGRHVVGTDSTMRVMSVDGAGGRASAKDIVQVTRLYSVDVVVVTGLTGELAHQLTVEGMTALAPPQWVDVPAGSGNGTGLWARPKIDSLVALDDLGHPGVQGSIDAGADRVGIDVVHLSGSVLRPGRAWRSDLIRLAATRPPGGEGIMVGDLAACPWQPAFRRLTASHWRDATDVVGQGLRPTWPSWSPVPIVPTDHVLITPGIGVSEAETTPIRGSDHRALVVTVVLPHAGG